MPVSKLTHIESNGASHVVEVADGTSVMRGGRE